MRVRALVFLLIAAFGLSACSGGGGTSPAGSVAGPLPAQPAAQSASIVIKIPAPGSALRAKFVSVSTQSISITLAPNSGCTGCTAKTTVNANLTTSSPGCVTVSNATTCTIPLQLNPGSYTAAVTTYDAVNQGGNALSNNQSVPVTIAVGTANQIPMTLYGIPDKQEISLVNSSSTASILPGSLSVTTKITIDALQSATFLVTPLDADNNAIVGPGAPTLTLPFPPNSAYYTATLNASASTVTVKMVATGAQNFIDMETAFSGPACTTNPACGDLNIYLYQSPVVAISDQPAGKVQIYNVRSSTFATANSPGSQPTSITFDASGNLFIADANNFIYRLAPPYTGTATTISSGVSGIIGQNGLAVDASGNLFAANSTANTVTEYASPYTGAPQT
jgi:hypothetical protein